ncbi:Gfo/Idh/MocA family protein [Natronococcus roseus]|uniref:Gfo/Idh/MocA family protein n=1 Tax=Natronococcus roseus TaxID=1052014 RepID=UPI00374D5B97
MVGDSTPMRFGVIGTAGIAQKAFLPAVEKTNHEVVAISSRNGSRAKTIADEYGIDRSYGTYDAILEDEAVDAVYVPLPNTIHAEWTKRAADAEKHVLCEKPLAVDTAEARDVVDHCTERGMTLLEGYMYRYHPRTERALALAANELENIRSITATFRYPLYDQPDNVRLDPDLAGGSLMDVGCYPVSLTRAVLGTPTRVSAHALDSRDIGVDTEFAGLLEYDDAVAHVASGFDTQKRQRYRIDAANGWLEVENAFDVPDGPLSLEYRIDGRHAVETFDPVDQFRLEIDHFTDCVQGHDRPRTGGESAIGNTRLIEALKQSASEGCVIDL